MHREEYALLSVLTVCTLAATWVSVSSDILGEVDISPHRNEPVAKLTALGPVQAEQRVWLEDFALGLSESEIKTYCREPWTLAQRASGWALFEIPETSRWKKVFFDHSGRVSRIITDGREIRLEGRDEILGWGSSSRVVLEILGTPDRVSSTESAHSEWIYRRLGLRVRFSYNDLCEAELSETYKK